MHLVRCVNITERNFTFQEREDEVIVNHPNKLTNMSLIRLQSCRKNDNGNNNNPATMIYYPCKMDFGIPRYFSSE